MYQTGAGGVAGGVVVYLARLSALGFRLFMATFLGLQIFNCVVVTTSCVPLVAQLLLYKLLIVGLCLTSWMSITCAFFLTAIPANRDARFDEMPWVTSWLTCSLADGCEYKNERSRIQARACQLFSPARLIESSKDTSRSRLAFLRALSNCLFLACQF